MQTTSDPVCPCPREIRINRMLLGRPYRGVQQIAFGNQHSPNLRSQWNRDTRRDEFSSFPSGGFKHWKNDALLFAY